MHSRTLVRFGDSVNVVNAVRWLHSEVIAKTPTAGSSSVTALRTSPNSSWLSAPPHVRSDAQVAIADASSSTVAIISRPARVSTVLRSSTSNRRPSHCGLTGVVEIGRSVLVAVATGLSNADIGRSLFMSEATVKPTSLVC